MGLREETVGASLSPAARKVVPEPSVGTHQYGRPDSPVTGKGSAGRFQQPEFRWYRGNYFALSPVVGIWGVFCFSDPKRRRL